MSSTEVIQRAAAPVLHVEIPTAVAASSPDPSVGEEGLHADLDMVVGVDAGSLDPKAARILPEVVTTMWEVHRLWEILPTRIEGAWLF
jgi:hypothetical protein